MVTDQVRLHVQTLAATDPNKFILADSRERIGLFRECWLKPNQAECLRAVGEAKDVTAAAQALAKRAGRAVFCTIGEQGILVADPAAGNVQCVDGFEVTGPIDSVGAGDSTSAAIACAVAAGASMTEAAAFGNLIASITIKQLGTTGSASPEQVRARWRAIMGGG